MKRHESLIDAIRLCYGKVNEVIVSSDVTYVLSQKYSSKLMRICIEQFGAARMACSFEESATTVIGQFLPVWYRLVVQTLSRIQSVNDINTQLAVIMEMLRSIPIALEVFQDGCEDLFNEMMRIFWNLLCLIRDDNERSSVMTSGMCEGHDLLDCPVCFHIITNNLHNSTYLHIFTLYPCVG